MSKNKGFTLIELLVVIAIMVILTAIVLVAVNPARQYQMARNTKRRSDANAILNALNQYQVDHDGSLPTAWGIATCPAMSDVGTSGVDLSGGIVASYIAEMPIDPHTACDVADTCYDVCVTNEGRVRISAPRAELGEDISVTR